MLLPSTLILPAGGVPLQNPPPFTRAWDRALITVAELKAKDRAILVQQHQPSVEK